ncbi:MAG: Na+/H+ antiporter subunit E [Pseudomonadota bacterium]|nr:MAG: Na+/H+ antiporter subunit E [Pseudomonadota bacterium]
MLHAISLASALYVFWLLLSGFFTAQLLILGVVSVVLVVFVANRMDAVDHEGHPLNLTSGAPAYWAWLLVETIKSNIDVARCIWQRRPAISPTMIRVTATQGSALGRTVYANSITLTPGTITTDVMGNEFEVHALTREAAAAVEEGEMDRRVSRIVK